MDLRLIRTFRKILPSGFKLCELPLVGPCFTYLKKISHPSSIQDAHGEGHTMYLDAMDSLNLSIDPIFERAVTDFVRSVLQPGDVAVDIGANIGYHTLLMAKLVGDTGLVYAFEPDPSNFSLLTRNVDANGYRNVVLIPKGVWSQSKPGALFLSEDNRGDHRTYRSDGRESVAIDLISLDEHFADLDRPVRLVKMDIQGAELEALRGMRAFLARQPDLIMITECWAEGLEQGGGDVPTFLDALREVGFELSLLTKEGIRVASNHEILEYTRHRAHGFSADLVCRFSHGALTRDSERGRT